MISKQAIEAFLDRDLGSYDWIKKCTERELDEALNELDPVPNFHTNPWIYQKACFLLLLELKRFMTCLDMGLGKTKIMLDLISYQKQCGKEPLAIVFVPYISAIETWLDEVSIHTPHLNCIPLIYGTNENLDLLVNEEADLFIVQYQSAAAMLTHDKIVEGKSGKKTKWDMKPAKIRKVFGDFDTMIIDESQKIANIHSLYFRITRAISQTVDNVYELTGTPFGKDIMYLWPQFYVLDTGETLGETLGLFRGALFNEEDNFWGGYKYTLPKKNRKVIYRMIKNKSIRYKDSECEDIPPKIDIVKKISLPDATSKYYKKASDELKELAKFGKQNYKQIESTFMQLLQLSSGFMTLKGEDDNKVKIKFKDNPKLDTLMELIDTIPENRKIVIFHFFVYSNELISEQLTKAKIPHSRVYGKTKDPISEIKRFKKDPKCRILVINSKSGSSALNLQVANYVIFYEIPLSLIDFLQSIKRCWRRGQTRRVYFYFLIVKNTVDQKLYNYAISGNELFRAILDGKEKL